MLQNLQNFDSRGRDDRTRSEDGKLDLLFADGLDAFKADLMSPPIAEIILVKKALVDAEMKPRKQHLPGVCSEPGAAG